MEIMTDVDGMTSTSILMKLFHEKLNYPVKYYIPNRLNEGYGLRNYGIDRVSERGCDLIITVDCGITSVEEVEYAKSLGIDVVASDHHKPKEVLPDACAVINPHRHDCEYPNKNLAGCGVAYKLACALYPKLTTDDDWEEYLSIVAFGSIADVVSLTGENRIFAYYGCRNMGETSNIGLKTLIKRSGINDSKITAGQVGFTIAPKLNATGRLGESDLGVRLLTTKDEMEAFEISKELIELNKERQDIENEIIEKAVELIESDKSISDRNILIVANEGWHTGILGIATSKICDKYNKPTILMTIENGMCKGSARSIPEFNMFESLQSCDELMDKWGGHPMAAGLSLKHENLNKLTERLSDISSTLSEEDLMKKLKVDYVLQQKDINESLINELLLFEPYGIGNPTPQFALANKLITGKRTIGKNNNHCKLNLKNGMNAICFGNTLNDVNCLDKLDILGQLSLNEFRGEKTIQILIKDYKKR